jgi:hypothetical protein
LWVAAAVIAAVGVAWDALAVLWVVFPGGSGEWTRLAIPAAYVVGVPCGLLSVLLLWLSRSTARARLFVLFAAVLSVLIPILMSLCARPLGLA